MLGMDEWSMFAGAICLLSGALLGTVRTAFSQFRLHILDLNQISAESKDSPRDIMTRVHR